MCFISSTGFQYFISYPSMKALNDILFLHITQSPAHKKQNFGNLAKRVVSYDMLYFLPTDNLQQLTIPSAAV